MHDWVGFASFRRRIGYLAGIKFGGGLAGVDKIGKIFLGRLKRVARNENKCYLYPSGLRFPDSGAKAAG